MASRTTHSGASTPPLTGVDLLNEYADRFDTLFDASALPLITIGGTANAVTATLDPPLATAGLFVDGMKFEITWGAANTAGVTLALNGGSAIAVLDPAGTALAAGAIGSGLRSLLEYIGGAFRILSPLLTSLGGGSQRYYWQFTASGTWMKPAGLDDDAMVLVEAWGGGGGGNSGASGGGGGGGAYSSRWFRAADLASSISVTIGPGGAVNSRGGNTMFGALITAYNGGAGGSGGNGGGGGGELSQGGNGGASPGQPGAGGSISGGAGADTTPNAGTKGGHWGGGGGGSGTSSGAGGSGAGAVFGGGGGAGAGTGVSGGQSLNGGSGGTNGVAGTAPGGGGGRNAAGARGEVRVWI